MITIALQYYYKRKIIIEILTAESIKEAKNQIKKEKKSVYFINIWKV